MHEFSLQEIPRSDVPENVLTLFGAAETEGRFLRFKNAVLARAEVNSNRDELDVQGLTEIAASLPLTPIDVEHRNRDICGYYVAARVEDEALYTDGIIFADRYPEVAAGMQSVPPVFHQSIEALAAEAECSVCHNIFTSQNKYCAHLSSKRQHGAIRKLRHMTAVGGAVTRNPAGTRADFDPAQMAIFASLEADANLILSFENEAAYALFRLTGKTLSDEARAKLSDDDYALIQKKDGQTLRRFPLNDRVHAQKALQLLPKAKNLSAEERAQVKKKAEAKLKELGGDAQSHKAAVDRVMNALCEDTAALNPAGRQILYSPVFTPNYQFTPAGNMQANDVSAKLEKTISELQGQVKDLEEKVSALKPNGVKPAKIGMTVLATENKQNTGASLRVLPQ